MSKPSMNIEDQLHMSSALQEIGLCGCGTTKKWGVILSLLERAAADADSREQAMQVAVRNYSETLSKVERERDRLAAEQDDLCRELDAEKRAANRYRDYMLDMITASGSIDYAEAIAWIQRNRAHDHAVINPGKV